MKKTFGGIGLIILGALFTSIFAIYEPGIKNFLGINPRIIWEKQVINVGDFHSFKATIYNESASSGDLTLSIKGNYTEDDFEIEGHQSKIKWETDANNTYLIIDSVYPQNEITLNFATTTYKYIDPYNVGISSRTFKVRENFKFPLNERYKKSKLPGIILVVWIFGSSMYIAYYFGKTKNKLT